jgi:DNA mismatch repair ATPase MutS
LDNLSRKQHRIEVLQNQVKRLSGRITALDARSNRYSWTRLAIFLGGLAITIVAYVAAGLWLCLASAVVTLVAFNLVAYYHRKIDRSIRRYRVWIQIKESQIARMELNWDAIPSVTALEVNSEHPFEIDLDITGEHSLHRLINTAVSREGSLRLREWLLNRRPDPLVIAQRQQIVRELIPLTLFRDKLLLNSVQTRRGISDHWEGQKLLRWLNQNKTSTSSLRSTLLIASTLSAITIVTFLLGQILPLPNIWIGSFVLYVLFLFSKRGTLGDNLFEDASYLQAAFSQLSGVFGYLERYPYGKNMQLRKICEPFLSQRQQRPSSLLGSLAGIASATSIKGNVLLWVLINAIVPWDVYFAYQLSKKKATIAESLPLWFESLFELEALSSLASFAYLNPAFTFPNLLETSNEKQQPIFQGKELGHPLIPDQQKICNDFTLERMGEIVILTGSNMAGKSSFLRTLGVNLCLAYAGSVVNASQLQTVLFKLFTCIRVSDSVTEGYSYFYAEVRRLKALLEELEHETSMPMFFLIDEIFKGTNNRERLIGSSSFMQSLLGRNCTGLISTHDLELVKLADALPAIKNYHFREDVIDGQMVFDYKLRIGPSPTTNALKIMEMEGLPITAPGGVNFYSS